jgi:hypothetical protein
MALPGETGHAFKTCEDCGEVLTPKVLKTCAFYIGTFCLCGPYSRESLYYGTLEEAQADLERLEERGVLPPWARR